VAVLGGEWATVRFELSALMAGDDAPLGVIADTIVAEREEAGTRVPMPPEEYAESLREMYPPDVWSEAQTRWAAMSEPDRAACRSCRRRSPTLWTIRPRLEFAVPMQRATVISARPRSNPHLMTMVEV